MSLTYSSGTLRRARARWWEGRNGPFAARACEIRPDFACLAVKDPLLYPGSFASVRRPYFWALPPGVLANKLRPDLARAWPKACGVTGGFCSAHCPLNSTAPAHWPSRSCRSSQWSSASPPRSASPSLGSSPRPRSQGPALAETKVGGAPQLRWRAPGARCVGTVEGTGDLIWARRADHRGHNC